VAGGATLGKKYYLQTHAHRALIVAMAKPKSTEPVSIQLSIHPFEVGQSYFIRTVTYHLIGKLEAIADGFLILSSASWIADSGRFMQAIRDGKLDEVEPVGDAVVNIGSITDAFPWKHSLPKDQK
jgi:hypothetical protein